MNAQNNIRRKTLGVVFFFVLIFSPLSGLRAQVLTPPPGSEALQKLLNEKGILQNKNTQRKELREGLGSHYSTQEAEALYIVATSPRVQELLIYNLFSLKMEDRGDTKPVLSSVAACIRDSFDVFMGSYFRVDTIEGPDVSEAPLKGWRLELDSIKSLLNPSPMSGIAPAKELLLIPALRPSDNPGSCIDPGRYLTLIVAGIDANNNIIRKSDGRADLYEYLKPCPNNCPKKMNDIFNKQQ
ncbi:MAG: hypothetical protein IBJ09_03620 [Bacteroidia bacterium]|nr:hypothetical protein [Bacteroidia bacterium]